MGRGKGREGKKGEERGGVRINSSAGGKMSKLILILVTRTRVGTQVFIIIDVIISNPEGEKKI